MLVCLKAVLTQLYRNKNGIIVIFVLFDLKLSWYVPTLMLHRFKDQNYTDAKQM